MWIILIIFLFIMSIVVSFKIRFNNYKIYELFNKKIDKSSLFLSLGTKIGVGSIIGTTSAIIIGGYSSVLWMIIFSLLTSSLIYYEAYLGKKYNENNVSGPYYIIKNGYSNKKLAIVSLFLLILIYSFLFQMIQSNTISNILSLNYDISKNIICVCILVIVLITITLSIKDVISVMNKIVPFMCILFIIVSLYGIINNMDTLLINIDNLKFSYKSFFSGTIIGIKRSIFMNETLIGTTSVSSSVDNNSIETTSLIQVVGSYFITFVINILILLLLIIYNNSSSNYIDLISNVYSYSTGNLGLLILCIVIILFGITTILSGYYIGKSNIENILNSKNISKIFNVLFIIILILGIYINNNYLWKYLDYLMFVMIIINSYSIIKLLGSEYNDRK